ncbi:hypothetical protein [Carp edema virus]|nr:hypothetical protein [Carp edema virus]
MSDLKLNIVNLSVNINHKDNEKKLVDALNSLHLSNLFMLYVQCYSLDDILTLYSEEETNRNNIILTLITFAKSNSVLFGLMAKDFFKNEK